MNRITINGVTIELPTDMHVTIADGFIAVKHAKPAPMVAVEEVRHEVKPDRVVSSLLPPNVDKIIIRALKEHDGSAYMILLSKHVAKAVKGPYTYTVRKALRHHLRTMVEEGTLVVLKGGAPGEGHTLYGLASMQEKRPRVVNSSHIEEVNDQQRIE